MMTKYLVDYRDENYQPRVILVEAEGKQSAISEAKKQLPSGTYVIPKPRRAFIKNK